MQKIRLLFMAPVIILGILFIYMAFNEKLPSNIDILIPSIIMLTVVPITIFLGLNVLKSVRSNREDINTLGIKQKWYSLTPWDGNGNRRGYHITVRHIKHTPWWYRDVPHLHIILSGKAVAGKYYRAEGRLTQLENVESVKFNQDSVEIIFEKWWTGTAAFRPEVRLLPLVDKIIDVLEEA